EPGEWYLNRQTGTLTYVPHKGETPRNTDIIAPAALQLLAVTGDAEGQRFVEHVRFEGITFAHTDWRYPSADGASIVGPSSETAPECHSRLYGRGEKAAAMQASSDVPGVVVFDTARHCSMVDCTIENVGWYAVEIGDACRNVRVQGCTLRDMGAGGVKINGASARDSNVKRMCTGKHAILDNEITEGGRVFHSAVGILAMHAFGLHIAHNHIHDLFYSGISCGWEWGYHEHVSCNHLIEFNHIHDIGRGLLSDMGGIYTLGVQPGTVLRNNLIHGVRSAHYGGMCIYPDQGSSHILIENNVCYDTDETVFHQNYGRENVIVNNIFALGAVAAARYSNAEPHVGFTMMRNIFLSDGVPIFTAGYSYNATSPRHRSDMNLIYDLSGKRPCFVGAEGEKVSLKRWKELGYDVHSVVADPGFKSLKQRNFALKKDSPAFRIGFKPIDVSTVGPRPSSKRGTTMSV
ncbi:right-handed parallel beta-helix repeat-containing protein, partial [Verrucomicrobiota bacterium]